LYGSLYHKKILILSSYTQYLNQEFYLYTKAQFFLPKTTFHVKREHQPSFDLRQAISKRGLQKPTGETRNLKFPEGALVPHQQAANEETQRVLHRNKKRGGGPEMNCFARF